MSGFPYTWRAAQGYITSPTTDQPTPDLLTRGWLSFAFYLHPTSLPAPPFGFPQQGLTVQGPPSGIQFGPPPGFSPPVPPAASISQTPNPPGLYAGGRPSGIREGTNYLFPQKLTSIHVISDGKIPYESPNTKFEFCIFTTSSKTTIKELLHQLGVSGDPKKIGVTECLEMGNGNWCQGLTILADDERVDKALEFFGWDETRGEGRPPPWFVVHRG